MANQVQVPAVDAANVRAKGLFLHAGANIATLDDVGQVVMPEATDTYTPISHRLLWELVMAQLVAVGFTIGDNVMALWQGGLRFFGLIELAATNAAYTLVVGVRNSHDKTFPAGLVIGNKVFVCDNLAFSGEVRLSRKHTVYIMRDLPGLVTRAVGRITEARNIQDRRIAAYMDTRITDLQAHDLIVKSLDARVLPVTKLPSVLAEWRKPSHEEFAPRTLWSLSNAYTEVAKGNLGELPRRTQALYGLFDGPAGLIQPANAGIGDAEDAEIVAMN